MSILDLEPGEYRRVDNPQPHESIIRRLNRTLASPQPAWRIVLVGIAIFVVLAAVMHLFPASRIWIGGTIFGSLCIGSLFLRSKDRVQYAPLAWTLFIVSLLSSLGDPRMSIIDLKPGEYRRVDKRHREPILAALLVGRRHPHRELLFTSRAGSLAFLIRR